MAPEGVERRLTAILNADAVGYSRLMAGDEVATLATLKRHRDAMSELVTSHGGRVVDLASSAPRASPCCVVRRRHTRSIGEKAGLRSTRVEKRPTEEIP